MQIVFELTQNDFTEAYSVHRNSKVLTKWSRRLYVGIAALIVALSIIGFVAKPSVEAAKNLLPIVALIALWVAVLWVLPSWTMRRQFVNQPGAHGPRTVVMDESGVHWKWNGGSSDVEWKNYIRTAEGKNQILFYTSPACFNIVPKRAVAGEQLAELRSLLSQKIQPRK